MSVKSNIGVVTDGLVFYVDAGNADSYSGSGATWTDLVGGVDGTLTNMDTTGTPSTNYSSSNGGYLNLDGTDDYVTFGSVSATQFNLNEPFSVSFWVNLSWADDVAFPIIVSNRDSTSPYPGWEILGPSISPLNRRKISLTIWPTYPSQRLEVHLSNAITANQWVYACVTYDGSTNASGVSWYIDGSSVATTTTNDTATTNSISYSSATMNIGNRDALSGGFFRDSDIATCSVYNKELSASEVLQNYNALKNRFI
jgi:hypothetical protein